MNNMKTLLENIDSLYKDGTGDEGMEVGQDNVDTVTMDVPLLLRMLEYAREDAQDDMDLHDITDRLVELGLNGETLTMDDYETIVQSSNTGEY